MKLSKIRKQLDDSTINEMNGLSPGALKDLIAQAEEAMAGATRERDANPAYEAAKQVVKDLSEGLRDVRKRQTAKIQYSLRRLRELNGEAVGDSE